MAPRCTSLINGLSVDVEDWFHAFEQIPCSSWGRYEHRLSSSLDRTLCLFAEHRVTATFFILGYVAERYPRLVRRIAEAGHELGTHGYSHRLVYTLTPNSFRDDLLRAIAAIESAAGVPVYGHRAARFSIVPRSVWALDVLLECSLRYDSSIFPIRHYRYGWPSAPRRPSRIRRAGCTIEELPLPTLGLGSYRFPVAGGAYQRIVPQPFSHACLRLINATGQPFVLYLHPWELDPDHPRAAVAHHVALTHYCNLRSGAARFASVLQRFRFAPLGVMAAAPNLPEVSLR